LLDLVIFSYHGCLVICHHGCLVIFLFDEEDDGTLLTQVGSEVVTEENRVDVKKESGFSPYGGGFLRFNVKRFQIGLNFQFYTQSDFSYQTSTLELGYQF
jgi:hypothetical protein